jgi:hypothetical protein
MAGPCLRSVKNQLVPTWIFGALRATAKGKLRAGVSDYQIDNSKLTTHCAPPCKTCRRGGGLALDLISDTTVLCTEWGVDGKPSICYCCPPGCLA